MTKLIDKITNNLKSLLSNPIDSIINDFINGNTRYRLLSDGNNFLVLSFSNKIPEGTKATDYQFFFEYEQVAITVLIRDDSRNTFHKKEIQFAIEEAINAYELVSDHKEYIHLMSLSFDTGSDNSKCVGDFLNSLCIPLNADLITSPRYNGKLTDLPSFTINDHNKYEEVNLVLAQPLEKNEVENILCNKIPDFPGSWDPSSCIKIQNDKLKNQYGIISMKLLCRWF